MQLVIADTGPVNYLIPIGYIDLLPRLFQRVILPSAVKEELKDVAAPASVRAWIGSPPAWLEIMERPGPGPATLDDGEAAVIALALSLHADLVLIDERKWAAVNVRNPGTRLALPIEKPAASRGLHVADFAIH